MLEINERSLYMRRQIISNMKSPKALGRSNKSQVIWNSPLRRHEFPPFSYFANLVH